MEGLLRTTTMDTDVLLRGDLEDAEGALRRLAPELHAAMASAIGAGTSAPSSTGWLNHGYIQSITAQGGDPDTDVGRWAEFGAPVGIAEPIHSKGVFPPKAPQDRPVAHEEVYNLVGGRAWYTSVDQNAAEVHQELTRLATAGVVRHYATVAEARAAHGDLILSKLACLVQEKADGSRKTRLICDLRASRANELVKLFERLVLPRVSDVISDIRRLARLCGQSADGVELLVCDFRDAFHHMGVLRVEQRHQVVQTPGGVWVYTSLTFGGAGSPLVWGRVAAWLGRVTASLYPPDLVRTEIFTDDPLVAVRGSHKERRTRLKVILLLWSALGFRMSWRKLTLGKSAQWIGVRFDLQPDAIIAGLLPSFAKKLLEEARAMLAETSVPMPRLRRFVGKASFAAGLLLAWRGQLAPLWRAMADAAADWENLGPRGGPEAMVATRRIRHSLLWLRAFLDGEFGPRGVSRSIPILPAAPEDWVQIVVDASPWGLGGILYHRSTLVAWFADELSALDLTVLGVQDGSPDGQAIREAHACLVAARLWAARWRPHRTTVAIRSDSLAALGAIASGRSPAAKTLNLVARELALDVATGAFELSLVGHVDGESNSLADALSRLAAPGHHRKAMPPGLTADLRTPVPVRTMAWWRTLEVPTAGGAG